MHAIRVRDKKLGSGMKCATWDGVREKLSEATALYRVVKQLWAWHLQTVKPEDRAKEQRLEHLGQNSCQNLWSSLN